MSESSAPKGFRFLYSRQADKFKIQTRFLFFWFDLDEREFSTIQECLDYLKEKIKPRDWQNIT